jgi:hypothetical protein
MTVHDLQLGAAIEIAASPTEVYALVRQLTRMGEWSPENTGGRWIVGDGSSVGDRFEGANALGDREWTVVATVNRAEPGVAFSFHTGPPDQVLVQWGYEMTPVANGTMLTETWDVIQLPPALADAPPERLASRKAQVQEAMTATLAAMKATLES